jgi:hypothetical protein
LTDLGLDHLKAIHTKPAQLDTTTTTPSASSFRCAPMMREFIKTDACRDARYLSLEARVDRIERRLQLTDPSVDQPMSNMG